ncbi:CHAT domain-containing protein [Iningainema tapete]|uniref:Tetratricopeptide repeat protein n=1 Tax=Iningainema tapete BLCC-T55 TaxID=2748662 RepID=A0A8J6XUQ1_9CYAN|nr:tetratricopeptide repeat protein [Iningainema tapete]MBD2776392.1 tetratricopeptide repeat protein [Iningainema tapete BLCC-T55]
MSNRLKGFALATLVFSLTCGVGVAASDVVVKHTLAQTATSSDRKAEADKLFQDGVQQFRRGEYPKALLTYQRVLEIRRQLGDKPGEAATLNKLGEIYNGLNQPTQALEVLQQSVNLYKLIKDKGAVGEVLDNIGTSYRLKIDTTKALEFYQQALAIRLEVKDREGEGKTLSNIGFAYSNQEQYPKAVETLQQALAIHKEVKDKYREGYTLLRIGIVYGNLREYKREFEFYQQSLILNRELGNKDGEFRVLLNIGWHYNSQQDYVRAVEFWQHSLVIAREVQNKSLEAIILNNIADAYSSQKEYGKAIEFYQQALTLAREVKDKSKEADILQMMGNIYFIQKQYKQASQIYEQALAVAREARDKSREANILTEIGKVSFQQKQYPQAIENYQKALIIAQELKKKPLELGILRALGNIYFRQNQYEQAIKIYKQALGIAREEKDKSLESRILAEIGDTYNEQKMYDSALQFYQSALPLLTEIEDNAYKANFLIVIGQTYLFQNKDDQAIELFQRALKIFQTLKDKEGQMTALYKIIAGHNSKAVDFFIRELYSQAKVEYSRVIELAPSVINLAKELNKPEIQASTLGDLGAAYAFLRENKKAIETLQQAARMARDLKALVTEATALGALANIYRYQGEHHKQLEVNQRYLEIKREEKSKLPQEYGLLGEVIALKSLASTYNILGEHEKAVEIYQQALLIAQQIKIDKLPSNLRDNGVQAEISSLGGLQTSYSVLGKSNQALDFAQQAVKKAQASGIKEYYAEALIDLGESHTNDFKDYPQAIKVINQALIIARQIKEPKIEAQALKQLSDTYTKQGNHASALESAQQLLAIATRVESPSLEEDALNNLRAIYFSQGNYSKSLEIAQQNLQIVQSKMVGTEIIVLLNLIENYIYVGDTNQAFETARQALALTRKQSNLFFEVGVLIYLSKVYKFQGEYDKGIKIAEQALSISRQINNFTLEIESIAALASIYEATGQYQQITSLGEPLLGKIQKLNNPVKKAEVLIVVGKAYGLTGQYTKGKQLVEQGLATARELKNPLLEVQALTALGSIYSSLNNYGQALDLRQQSLKIVQQLKSPILQVDTLYFLGDIYSKLGDYKSSAKYYEQALAIVKQFNNRQGEGTLLLALASNYFYQGEANKTIDSTTKALAIFTDIKEPRLEALAKLVLSAGYSESNNDAKAMESAQAFLDFARKNQNSVWEKLALSNIGSLHRKFGRTEQAIVAYQQALAIQTDNQVKGADAGIYAGLARVYQDLNQPNIAITYYKESVNRLEEIRRGIEGLPKELQNSFLNSTIDFDKMKVSDIYAQLAGLLNSQGRYKEAFQIRLLIEEQEIREARGSRGVAEGKLNIPLTPTEAKIPEQGKITIALASQISECERTNCSQRTELNNKLTDSIQQSLKELQKIDKEIRNDRAKDDQFFNPTGFAKAQAIVEAQAKETRANTVMIYPLVLENELWLQVYGEKGLVKTEKVPVSRKELRNTVKKFRELMGKCEPEGYYCGVKDIAEIQPVSQQLYKWLIEPLEVELKDNQVKNLIFTLHREIRYIPMSALHDGKQYLIEKYTIHNVTTESFNEQEKPPTNIQTTPLLAMGLSESAPDSNPNSNKHFRALRYVPKELDAIVRENTNDKQGIYPGKEYLNKIFNFEILRDNLNKYKILHLATHGVFDSTSPEQSYILMGTGKPLTPIMISSLIGLKDIHLVVLSACQTALATSKNQDDPQDGVEINTLAYEFMNRGAKSVMASLWIVDDLSTSQLIQLFYKNLATGKMTKSQALRQAQLSLLKGNHYTGENDAKRGVHLERELGALPRKEQRKSSYSHPYYWAPFILIGNGL